MELRGVIVIKKFKKKENFNSGKQEMQPMRVAFLVRMPMANQNLSQNNLVESLSLPIAAEAAL